MLLFFQWFVRVYGMSESKKSAMKFSVLFQSVL